MRTFIAAVILCASCGDEPGEAPRWRNSPVGASCRGDGICAEAPGVVELTSAGDAICSTVPGGSADASAVERCDGVDNDCNGIEDDVEQGQCDRCLGLNEAECAICEDADARGIFPRCNACGDCDRVAGPGIDGFLCGCISTLDCPCGFRCGELELGAGILVAGCVPP